MLQIGEIFFSKFGEREFLNPMIGGCLHSKWMLNQGYACRSVVDRESHGLTLLSYLARCYSHSTRQAWQEKLSSGEIRLNGVIAGGRESVLVGQVVVWNRPPWEEPEAPRHFEVVFEDEHLLAVNKPSGLPTLPGGGFMENTLLRLVQRQAPEANPVHRLGRGTSGLVLFAKTSEAAARLSASWNTLQVQKVYRALAQGVAERDAYEIHTAIGRVAHPRMGWVWAAHPAGKPSKSLARVMLRAGGETTFEVRLESGRPHQIRIHLASVGHPLVGDPLYGFDGQPLESLPGLPGDGGYLLHAHRLRFVHPVGGEWIEIEAALPEGLGGAEGILLAREIARDTNSLAIVQKVFVNQSEVNAAVRRAEELLAQSVVRIRYDLDSDWTGDPSIFFRIVLTDQAAGKAELNDVANAVSLILMREVRPEEHGLHSYFNFRSESEQSQLKESAWA